MPFLSTYNTFCDPTMGATLRVDNGTGFGVGSIPATANCSAIFGGPIPGTHLNAGDLSAIIMGDNNTINTFSEFVLIGNGQQHIAQDCYTTIVNGCQNSACGNFSFVGSGLNNYAIDGSFIGGGLNHCACNASFVGIGNSNCALGINSFSGGGSCNNSFSDFSFIGAGQRNLNAGQSSFIGSGMGNIIGVNADCSAPLQVDGGIVSVISIILLLVQVF